MSSLLYSDLATSPEQKFCSRHCKQRARKLIVKPYLTFKGTTCEECGFVPKHNCQLDVDHIDGDHSNNKPGNLRTLCANCHRLKTWMNKDFVKQDAKRSLSS